MKNRGFRRTLADFRRHPWLHAISISTITISLFIIGVFFVGYRNFKYMAEKTSPKTSGTVYLKDALSESRVRSLSEKILSLENVQKVQFKTKQSLVKELEEFLGSKEEIVSLPEGELFPDVIEIELRKNAGSAEVAILRNILVGYPDVSEVDFSENWLAQFERVQRLLKIFGALLMVGLLVSCTFIIANFMGMRHQSRKEEIDIVRLIGAHEKFVLAPFLWEGVMEGLMGAILALGLTYLVKLGLGLCLRAHWTLFLGVKNWLYLSAGQFACILLIGIAMAFFGSLTVFLRFQQSQK